MEVKFKRDTTFRKQFFVPDSFAHPAKMDAQLLIWIVEHYTEAGETILDPMAGSGTTMLACTLGRNVVLVELEDKFCKMMQDNWEQVKMKPQLGYLMGECQIMQGDARQLEGLLVDKIITSPPFFNTSLKKNFKTEEDIIEFAKKTKLYREGRSLEAVVRMIKFNWNLGEAEDPNNISNLPYGQIDKIVTSRHKWLPASGLFGCGFVVCQKCGIEVKASQAKRGAGKCPTRQIDSIITSPPYGNPRDITEKSEQEYENRRLGEEDKQHGRTQFRGRYEVDSIITSPPYGEALKDTGAERLNIRVGKGHGADYSDNPSNIGNLSYGNIDSIITSPPFAEPVNKPQQKQVKGEYYKAGGKLAGGYLGETELSRHPNSICLVKDDGAVKMQSYLEAMLQVYQNCFAVLRDGGLCILVTKNFIRNKQVIRLDLDTIKLCEQAGFQLLERHYRKLPAQSFWRVIYYQKHPDVEQINYEDILAFRKPH